MKTGNFITRLKAEPLTFLLAILAFIAGILFIVMQGARLFHSTEAGSETLPLLIGQFERGFVWADVLLPGPFLIVGAIYLFIGRKPLGHLFTFAGWAINFYDMIVFFAGYSSINQPPAGALFNELLLTALIALMCMVWSVVRIAKDGYVT